MAVLFASLFIVMIGYGSTLTVLPSHIERAGDLAQSGAGGVAFHVGSIVGIYALAGLVASPIVGRLGDRVGRRPMLLAGLGGLATTQIAFGLAGSLWTLYVVRFAGGIADAAVLVTATAYVADSTSEDDRPRGMAWFGTAVSVGLVAGPAFTSLLTRSAITVGRGALHFEADAVPFLFSGLVAASVMVGAGRHLPESNRGRTTAAPLGARHPDGSRLTPPTLGPLLVLVVASQYGLAIFEGMFVLYARDRFSLSVSQISLTFIACNATIAVLQLPAVGWLTHRVSALTQVAFGFALLGTSLTGLLLVRSFPLVLAMSSAHGAGAALVGPNLSALVSTASRAGAGVALGLKNSASGLGQFLGPFVGGSLMRLGTELPFLVAGALLIAIAFAVRAGFGAKAEEPLWGDPVAQLLHA